MSSVLFLAWWLAIPVAIGIFASRSTSRRSGTLVWFGVLAVAAFGLVLNSAMQTYGSCGLTLAEMRADPSTNCTYATNSIRETFFAHLMMTGFLAFATFITATFIPGKKRRQET